jgi:uncharacterized protein
LKKNLSLLILFFILPWYGHAQNVKSIHDHKSYLGILSHSKDSLYAKMLSEYDHYIGLHSSDYKVQLERCKFIENAYYDYSEEYNPKYEEAERCSKELTLRFPNTPEVLLYRSGSIYGDSAIIFLKKLEVKIKNDPATWNTYSWKVYESLANHYRADSNRLAIQYGELAMEKNDTLDLTLLLGRLYKETSRTKKAIDVLTSKLDSTQQSWELNQKGKLLLELGAPEKAILAYQFAKKDSTGWQDSGSLGQAFIDNGLIMEARDYLLKETTRNTWNNSTALYKLFDYDVRYGLADSAKASYLKLIENNFWNDPIGVARIRLFFKAPMAAVTFQDTGRVLLLILVSLLFFVIPYTWILPIHYAGVYFKKRGTLQEASSFRWGLRHLWIAFSMWFFVEYIVLACFDYPSIIAIFNKSMEEDVIQPISYLNAKLTLFFFIGMLLLTLGFLKPIDVRDIWIKIKNQSRYIWTGIGLSFLLRFGLGIYLVIIRKIGWLDAGESLTILSINDDIMSINEFYHPMIGFLFVVILVPIYEEILFRGVFLSACEKHINFLVANILQAFVFALAHQNLKLFIFYFAFGFVAGHYRNRTQSLVTGLSLHISNNFVAFLSIVALQKIVG